MSERDDMRDGQGKAAPESDKADAPASKSDGAPFGYGGEGSRPVFLMKGTIETGRAPAQASNEDQNGQENKARPSMRKR